MSYTPEQVLAQALDDVADLPLTKDGKDLNGNSAYGLDTRTYNAFRKALGFGKRLRPWEVSDPAEKSAILEQERAIDDWMRPVRARVCARRKEVRR